jgi:hypothetical protein
MYLLMLVRPLQAIWYICRRVLTPVQEAHLCSAAASLDASPDMLSLAEARPVANFFSTDRLQAGGNLCRWSGTRRRPGLTLLRVPKCALTGAELAAVLASQVVAMSAGQPNTAAALAQGGLPSAAHRMSVASINWFAAVGLILLVSLTR